jgi:hypothetical protein
MKGIDVKMYTFCALEVERSERKALYSDDFSSWHRMSGIYRV